MKHKLLVAAALLIMGMGSASAQVGYQKANLTDNLFLGVKVGVTTPFDFNPTFPLNTAAGIKFGKWFSPVWGANLEGLWGFGDNGLADSHTFVRTQNLGLNGMFNITNAVSEYKPERVFEVALEAGMGYLYIYGDPVLKQVPNVGDDNDLSAKTGLTLNWNLGKLRAWQIYAEPTVYWNLTHGPGDAVQFNRHYAQLGLFVGLNYKFLTSNGTHNFKVLDVDELNEEINNLRAELAKKPKEIIKEKEVIKEVKTPGESTEAFINSLYFVTFQQGKFFLTKEAKESLNEIEAGRHVDIVGTASPEGSKEFNDRLSQNRANAVANYLKTRGVIIDSAVGQGVKGVTSNRLAIVRVK